MIHLDYRDARPIYTQVIDGFRELELQGCIVSVPGKGSFVGTIPTTGEMRDLYDRFDRTALELLAAGATTRALRERIPEKGAENNA